MRSAWLGQLLAELIKCCSSAGPGILQCLCTGDVLSRALLQPQRPLKCFKQTLSCRIHWGNSTFPSLSIFLCVLKPLYFIPFAARSWLCDNSRESLSAWCLHTPPDRKGLFSPHFTASENVTFPQWNVTSRII